MVGKLAATLLLAGILAAPAYATGTSSTQAGMKDHSAATKTVPDTRSAADKTKEVVGDATITTKVKAKFAADDQVSALKIRVDTDNGIVKLSGDAKSQAEADKAVQIAKNTEGVTSVMNDIRVATPGTKY